MRAYIAANKLSREAHPDALASGNGGSGALQGPELTAQFRRALQAAEKLSFFKIRRFRSRFGVQQTIKKIAQSVCRASYDIDDLLPFRMSEFFRSL
jgi:hypothetical protein